MNLQGRALYNLLRNSWLEDSTIDVKPWQVEDYRSLPIKEIFRRLKAQDIALDEAHFREYAANCDSPEELADCLWLREDDIEGHDRVYLLVFELWRRLLPEKQVLSLFCDDLDVFIDLYDKNSLDDEELLQDALADLEDILDQNVDAGGQTQDVFLGVSQHCAHDIESFIFDFIADQIDAKNELYASELLDAFYEFAEDPKWFDFLRARLFASTDPNDGNVLLAGILEQLREEADLDLLMIMIAYLINSGESNLFLQAVQQALPLLKKEGEFQEVLSRTVDYYRCLDREEEEKMAKTLLQKRAAKKTLEPFDQNDDAINQYLKLIARASIIK